MYVKYIYISHFIANLFAVWHSQLSFNWKTFWLPNRKRKVTYFSLCLTNSIFNLPRNAQTREFK